MANLIIILIKIEKKRFISAIEDLTLIFVLIPRFLLCV